eukprot:3940993-Rhodomonas_salina.1
MYIRTPHTAICTHGLQADAQSIRPTHTAGTYFAHWRVSTQSSTARHLAIRYVSTARDLAIRYVSTARDLTISTPRDRT